mmetsp:Transcript_42377/g.136944  ORF Transcript_42377/g.136944 Transcript_42377/m.136944 type:complete len:251 (+) Transcript_42377:464-1216(+)
MSTHPSAAHMSVVNPKDRPRALSTQITSNKSLTPTAAAHRSHLTLALRKGARTPAEESSGLVLPVVFGHPRIRCDVANVQKILPHSAQRHDLGLHAMHAHIHVGLLYCAVLDLLVGKDVAKLLLDGSIQLLPILLHPHNTIGVGLASSGPPLPSLCLLFVRLLLIEVAALRIRGRAHVVEFLVDIIRRATALCRHLSRYRLVGLAVLWIVQIIRQVIFCAALGNLVDVAASNMLVCLPAWLEVCRQCCLA